MSLNPIAAGQPFPLDYHRWNRVFRAARNVEALTPGAQKFYTKQPQILIGNTSGDTTLEAFKPVGVGSLLVVGSAVDDFRNGEVFEAVAANGAAVVAILSEDIGPGDVGPATIFGKCDALVTGASPLGYATVNASSELEYSATASGFKILDSHSSGLCKVFVCCGGETAAGGGGSSCCDCGDDDLTLVGDENKVITLATNDRMTAKVNRSLWKAGQINEIEFTYSGDIYDNEGFIWIKPNATYFEIVGFAPVANEISTQLSWTTAKFARTMKILVRYLGGWTTATTIECGKLLINFGSFDEVTNFTYIGGCPDPASSASASASGSVSAPPP